MYNDQSAMLSQSVHCKTVEYIDDTIERTKLLI